MKKLTRKEKLTRNEKLVFMALLVAQALVLGIIERMIPVPFICPGAKLGLANIVTVVALYYFSFAEILTIVVLRITLLAFFAGSLSSFLYSLSGGMLSFFVMYLLLKLFGDRIGTMGISVAGAVFHNIGQVVIASLVVQNFKMFFYFPVLLVTGIGTGIFVGLTAQLLLTHMKKIPIMNNIS